MPTEPLIIHDVSLSHMYKKTTADWKTLKRTERTDNPCNNNIKKIH